VSTRKWEENAIGLPAWGKRERRARNKTSLSPRKAAERAAMPATRPHRSSLASARNAETEDADAGHKKRKAGWQQHLKKKQGIGTQSRQA
jgi:hypothetical protein